MKQIVRSAKTLLVIFVSFSICCTSIARKRTDSESKELTIAQVRDIADKKTSVKFADESDFGFCPECRVLGWTREGFILDWGGRVDTAEYELFKPVIQVSTGKSNARKGAIFGTLLGLGISSLLYFLARESDKSAGVDTRGMGVIITTTRIVPQVLAGSACLGALLGDATKQYKKYSYDYREFRNSPWH
ncbi:MAG: hypothetical protein GY839_17890 [candidate division Zixibacteria bacterium]|nr:hypothetical protein [candidate division Zixibacteria bacterium]